METLGVLVFIVCMVCLMAVATAIPVLFFRRLLNGTAWVNLREKLITISLLVLFTFENILFFAFIMTFKRMFE